MRRRALFVLLLRPPLAPRLQYQHLCARSLRLSAPPPEEAPPLRRAMLRRWKPSENHLRKLLLGGAAPAPANVLRRAASGAA